MVTWFHLLHQQGNFEVFKLKISNRVKQVADLQFDDITLYKIIFDRILNFIDNERFLAMRYRN